MGAFNIFIDYVHPFSNIMNVTDVMGRISKVNSQHKGRMSLKFTLG